MGNLIEGGSIARGIEQEVMRECASLVRMGVVPSLVAVSVGQDPASHLYLKRQRQACRRLGANHRNLSLPLEISQQDLLRQISRLNANPEVTGILLQMPLPEHLSPRAARRAIHPNKDVEGLHPQNLGRLLSGKPGLVPCTAEAVLECILSTGVAIRGSEAVIVGHSEIVGKPVALLLMERQATVSVCHVATQDLDRHIRRADILVVAVGRPELISGHLIKEGALVVDVGINEVQLEGKLAVVGDVQAQTARERAAHITPVPGGVGPVTVAVLMRNMVKAAASQGPLPV